MCAKVHLFLSAIGKDMVLCIYCSPTPLLSRIHFSLIYGFSKCLPIPCLANSFETWLCYLNFDSLFLMLGFIVWWIILNLCTATIFV